MASDQTNAFGVATLKDGVDGWYGLPTKTPRPKTGEEMLEYMSRIGVYEGYDFLVEIVHNGWAADKAEAEIYLETLGIFPWDD